MSNRLFSEGKLKRIVESFGIDCGEFFTRYDQEPNRYGRPKKEVTEASTPVNPSERRGRPSKTHREGELRPCVECRNHAAEALISESQSAVKACAEALVEEFIRKHVKK